MCTTVYELFLTVCLSDRLLCYIDTTYIFFDRSYIHWTNSCIWIVWNTIKESKESKKVKTSGQLLDISQVCTLYLPVCPKNSWWSTRHEGG